MRRHHSGRLAPGLLLMAAVLVGPLAKAAEHGAMMTVVGRVLDPSGKPVPHAAVTVMAMQKYPDRPMLDTPATAMILREKRCDGMGRFRVEMPRTTSARYDGLIIMALAPGFGVGWTVLDADVDSPASDVALRPERVLRGRLFDVQGRPASGVALRVVSMNRGLRDPAPVEFIVRPDAHEPRWTDSPAWPGPAISDDQGRFTLGGLGPELVCGLAVDDPRFAPLNVILQTDGVHDVGPRAARGPVIKVDPSPDAKPVPIALKPARTISGRVLFADTRRPVPRAVIMGGGRYHLADAEGRFRAPIEQPARDTFSVRAQAPDPVPYLMATKQGQWSAGAVEQSVVLELHRGVVVRGKVVEEETARPVAGAIVRFMPQSPAAGASDIGLPVTTGPDGTYRIAGPPGPGYVVVQGPSDDYVLREFGGQGGFLAGLRGARPGRERFYAHAYHAAELKPDEPEPTINLALRPGVSVALHVDDPDGRPAREVLVVSRLIATSLIPGGWRVWGISSPRGRGVVQDGHFAVHGLEPDVEAAVCFLDPLRKLGAAVRLSGRSAKDGPVTIRLEPCGAARARLVGPDGKPHARIVSEGVLAMVVAPGPPYQLGPARDGPLFAIAFTPARLDTVNYEPDERTDAEGRVTFPALIPGAPYRVLDHSAAVGGGAVPIRKEFTVKAGETVDLGDVLIERPRR